jgi:hypothetical protein
MFEGIEGLNLDNDFYRSIVGGNSLFNFLPKESVDGRDELDPSRTYRFNSYGYRGEELKQGAKFVSAGCSFTYGLGIPEDAIWANIIARDLNLTHNSVAKSGASIGWIVEKLFNYFKEFGHPKYLICLMPDAKRFVVPVDGIILTSDKNKKTKNIGMDGSRGGRGEFLYNEVSKSMSEMCLVNFLKRPYNIRDIYTPDMGYYNSIRSIRVLEQYCKAVGIKFLWSTWDFEFAFHLEKINQDSELKFNSYFPINTFFYRKKEKDLYKDAIFTLNVSEDQDVDRYLDCIENHNGSICSCYCSCHEGLIDVYGVENFHAGTDSTYGEQFSHPGAHLHAHYAARMIEALRLKYTSDFM